MTLSEIVAHEPDAAEAWLRDPAAAPHGGEPVLDLSRCDLAHRRAGAEPTVHHRNSFNNHTIGYCS